MLRDTYCGIPFNIFFFFLFIFKTNILNCFFNEEFTSTHSWVWVMLIIEDLAMTVECRTSIKALFL
jgi:hypothetical protein